MNENSFVITNNRQRKRAAFRLMVERKQKISEFMRQWGGVMVHDLVDWTPPRPKKGAKASWPVQKKTGEAAVKRDIEKVFYGKEQLRKVLQGLTICKNEPKLLDRLNNYLNSGDTDKLSNVLDNIGIHLKFVDQPTRELHFAERNSRGVVKRPKNRYFVKKGLAGYIREIQKDVGKLKSGWMTAAARIGLRVRDVPKWVTRHREPGKGEANMKGPNYFVKVTNNAKASKDHSPNAIVVPAMRILERKMWKSLKAIQNYNAARYNAPF